MKIMIPRSSSQRALVSLVQIPAKSCLVSLANHLTNSYKCSQTGWLYKWMCCKDWSYSIWIANETPHSSSTPIVWPSKLNYNCSYDQMGIDTTYLNNSPAVTWLYHICVKYNVAINIRIGKLLKRNMFKSLEADRGSNVYTHANEREVVVRIFAEWGTGFEHSRKAQIFPEDNSLRR